MSTLPIILEAAQEGAQNSFDAHSELWPADDVYWFIRNMWFEQDDPRYASLPKTMPEAFEAEYWRAGRELLRSYPHPANENCPCAGCVSVVAMLQDEDARLLAQAQALDDCYDSAASMAMDLAPESDEHAAEDLDAIRRGALDHRGQP